MKIKTYFMDLETYSEVPIQYGTHAYAADKSARILLWAYALHAGPVHVWDVDQEPNMPDDLRAAIHDIQSYGARHVWVNGVMFDTVFLQYRDIDLPLIQCDDVRVIAYQHALPGGLGELCKIFKLPVQRGIFLFQEAFDDHLFHVVIEYLLRITSKIPERVLMAPD